MDDENRRLPATSYVVKVGDPYRFLVPGTVVTPAPGLVLLSWDPKPTHSAGGLEIPDTVRQSIPGKATVLGYGEWDLGKLPPPPEVGARVIWNTGTQVGASRDGNATLCVVKAADLVASIRQPELVPVATDWPADEDGA